MKLFVHILLLALLLPVSGFSEQHYWQQLLQTGKPTAAQFEGMGLHPLPFIQRTTYQGWTDGTDVPPEAWYENMAANLVAPYGWAMVDQEDWPMDTQENRLASSAKFVTLFNGLKAHRPELKWGFYGMMPKRDLFRAREGVGDPTYIEWQAENDDLAAMAAVVDGFFPSIYFFYNIDQNGAAANDGVEEYLVENIREAKRLRDTYGDPTRPIYPYIWWMRTPTGVGFLDDVAWIPMMEHAFALTNGCVIWGGFQEAWDDTAGWWQKFRARLPKRVQAGHYSQAKSAAGQW